MSGEPLVSVIMPVYNAEAYLARAVQSVLEQHHSNVELLAVDDGSTDASGRLLDELAEGDPRIRVFHGPNRGPSAARNVGLASMRGDYVALLDADDWLVPEKLERQVASLEAQPDVDLTYSDYREVEEASGAVHEVKRGLPPVPMPELLVYRPWFAPFVPLLRRRLADTVGGFDATMLAAEEWDYWYRCVQHTSFSYTPGLCGYYRLHDAQLHRHRDRMRTAQLQFAQKHFGADRRRRRSMMAYYHLSEAKHAKGAGDLIGVAAHLARFALSANSLREARLVWGLP